MIEPFTLPFRAPTLSAVLAVVIVGTSEAPARGQVAGDAGRVDRPWTMPRTPDGHPDLQGIWTLNTSTPLERPPQLKDKAFFTEQEAIEWEKGTFDRMRSQRPDGGITGELNEIWIVAGKVVPSRRTSLIVDPSDGRIPFTPDGQKRWAAVPVVNRENPADNPEDRPLAERCLLWNEGPPMLPVGNNDYRQIVQTRGYVVIHSEMIHNAQIVPIDGRPPMPAPVRQWTGDSIGRWEGDTLVVETRNFSDKTRFRGATDALRLVERFTRVADDLILYRFTVEDPATFTQPWTAEVAMRKSDGPIYEYACHEANYSMGGTLGGARAIEKAAHEAATKK